MSTTPGSTLAATALVFRLELVLPLFWLLDGFGTWPEEVPVEFPSLLLFSATAEPAPAPRGVPPPPLTPPGRRAGPLSRRPGRRARTDRSSRSHPAARNPAPGR